MNRTKINGIEGYASTAGVARALGVSVTTVKRWVDDGILPAHRTPGGHRKMLMADVVRLARDGNLPQADLTRLDPRLAGSQQAEPGELATKLAEMVRAGDAAAVRALIHGCYHSGLAIEAIADDVISPALARVGHDWEAGRIDVLHEHRGTQLVAGAVYELKATIERRAERQRLVAVGGAVEHDHYVLPSLLAQVALVDAGWDAVNLGPNTPFASFRRALDEFRPRLMWISISYLAQPAVFEREYVEFFQLARSFEVAVAIGGRALPDHVRSRIPYTTYGDGLGQLVAFAKTLHPRPKPPRRGRPPRGPAVL